MAEDWVRQFIPNYDNTPGRGYLPTLADPNVKLAPKASNFFYKMYHHPCARPWYLYVETFVPAFLNLAFTVGFLDMEDLIRDRARDIVSNDRRRPGRPKHRPGRKQPVRRVPVQRYISANALRTLLIVTAPLEAIGFAFLLYSAGDQFFGNWMSLIEKSDFCTQPIESGPFQRKGTEVNWSLNTAEFGVPIPDLIQNRGGWVNSGFHVEVPHGFYTCFFTAKIRAVLSDVNGVYIAVKAPVAIGSKTFKSGERTIRKGEATTFMVDVEAFQGALGSRNLTWHTGGATVPAGCIAEECNIIVQRVG